MNEEVRVAQADEVDEYMNMAGQAFRVNSADLARWRSHGKVEELRGLYVDGRLTTSLAIHDFDVWFGETTLKVGGIAAVASPPEYRRQGYIGKLLHGVLEDMRGRGQTLSMLYPFYYPFYKHFGWEQVVEAHRYKVPITKLPLGRTPGSWHKVYVHAALASDAPNGGIKDEDLDILIGLYDTWCKGRVGMIKRSRERWLNNRLGVGGEHRPDAYYWRNSAGEPRGYLIYNFEALENQWTRRIHCELVALDASARRAALEFLRNHDSQAKEVWIRQPEDERLLALFEDPEFSVEVEPLVMLRFVDIAAAITARNYANDSSGEFTIAVSDGFAAWNHGSFAVSYGGGQAEAKPTDAAGAIRLDQKVLARLYAGYLTPVEALQLGLLEADDAGQLDAMGRLFAGPRPYITDFF